MANLGSIAAVKADIDAKVTTNGANENTGARVNTLLQNMTDTIDALKADEMIPFITVTSGDIKSAYRYYDIYNSKPRYVQVIPGTTQAASAAASNFLWWITGDSKWHVWGNGGAEYHTSADAVATPDLVTTWVLANGAVAPLPTVELYEGTQQDLDEVLAAMKIAANEYTDSAISGVVGYVDDSIYDANAYTDAAVSGLLSEAGQALGVPFTGIYAYAAVVAGSSGIATIDLTAATPPLSSARFLTGYLPSGDPCFTGLISSSLGSFQVAFTDPSSVAIPNGDDVIIVVMGIPA